MIIYVSTLYMWFNISEKVIRCGFCASSNALYLQKFLEDNRLRLIDLFRKFDKNLSWKISPEEFKKGISDAQIPFTKSHLKLLMDSLDLDADGLVNYRWSVIITSILFPSGSEQSRLILAIAVCRDEKLRIPHGEKAKMLSWGDFGHKLDSN